MLRLLALIQMRDGLLLSKALCTSLDLTLQFLEGHLCNVFLELGLLDLFKFCVNVNEVFTKVALADFLGVLQMTANVMSDLKVNRVRALIAVAFVFPDEIIRHLVRLVSLKHLLYNLHARHLPGHP